MKNKKIVRLTRIAIFVAMALIMHFLEAMLPPLLPFAPGAKMGLSNVVILAAIILLGYPDAIAVQVIRCVFGSIFTNPFAIAFSLPAGVASLVVMILMYHFLAGRVSIMAISFVAAVVHNTVQALVAVVINSQIAILGILPLMLAASLIAGLFVGLVVYFLVKKLPNSVVGR